MSPARTSCRHLLHISIQISNITLPFHCEASVVLHLHSTQHTPCPAHCSESASAVKISTSLINKSASTCTNIWHSVLPNHPHTHPLWEVKACGQSGERVTSADSLQLNMFQFSLWKIKLGERTKNPALSFPFWAQKMAVQVYFPDEKLKPTDDGPMAYNCMQHKRRFKVQVPPPFRLSKGWKIQTPAKIARKL